jgi:hypothetical protein
VYVGRIVNPPQVPNLLHKRGSAVKV